jgi:hypothetical protein
METWNAPSVPRSTPRPWQRKHRAALSSRILIQRPSSRTLSNESGLVRILIVQLVRSLTSNSASVSVPTEWRHMYRVYITTHSKYHGQRWRRNSIVVHYTARPSLGTHIFSPFFFSFLGFFSTGPSRQPDHQSFRRMDIPRRQAASTYGGISRWYS